MAICKMAKVLIVSHRSEAGELLEAIQKDGICQILNAEQAIVSKEWPELAPAGARPKETEELLGKVSKAIRFLEKFTTSPKGLGAVLAPRKVIDLKSYNDIVKDEKLAALLERAGQCEDTIEKLNSDLTNISATIERLEPWSSLSTPLEELNSLEQATCFAGLLLEQKLEQFTAEVVETGTVVEKVGTAGNRVACLIVCLNEFSHDIHKILRSADFEPANFESMSGTAAELIEQYHAKLKEVRSQLDQQEKIAVELSQDLLNLQILFDHHTNLLSRERSRTDAPATEHTIFFEGWVKDRYYAQLAKTVSRFEASSISRMELQQGEDIPVEIENKPIFRPFESITRLYGMPKHVEFDPTALLAPFFALFFALCLTDAAYGIIIVAICAYILKRMQADKKLIRMLLICSALTIVAGALTGGWLGGGVEEYAKSHNITWLANGIDKMRLFDPLSNPMPFLQLSILLGYIQIMFGLGAGLVHNFRRKAYIPGLCDHLSWIVIINGILIVYAAGAGMLPAFIGGICKVLLIMGALLVLGGSHREGGIGARIGMGLYNLTGAIFYVGDILSYLRLMALGLGTAGVAIAVNIIAKLVADIPYVGFILAIIVLIGGHLFNIAMSALGAFIHSLRLQFVEFFPKFLAGGGTDFKPFGRKYEYIFLDENKE